ncbi:MAG: hypothetical protein DWP97_03680 [Calditrichaeota bacterium]|nr:MAG: hypothetical protein DWP97_03680 [Calditrichota bacterium]
MKFETKNRDEFLASMLHYLEALAADKNYAEMVKYYETHRNQLDSVGIAAGAIHHAVSKAYASLTQLQNALRTARLAQNAYASDGDSEQVADLFITIGSILRDMSEYKEAEKAYRDAESIYRRNDSLEGQSRSLNILAGLFFNQTDYKNALSVLLDALEIAKRLDNKKKLSFMMGNIGRIYTFTGDFTEAKKYLKRNIEISNELNDTLETARANLSCGYIYLQEADYAKAEKYFTDAYPLIVESGSARDEVYYLTYLGELYFKSSRLVEAKETLEKAISMANTIAPDSPLAARPMRHLAELELGNKNYNAARRLASTAWVVFEKTSDKVELGALIKIKAILAEQNGNNTESKQLYSQSIEMLSESSVRFEKADALIAAGQSKLFSTKQRLTYLFRAEEFYQDAKMTSHLLRVEKLISEVEPQKIDHNNVKPTPAGICPVDVDYITTSAEIQKFKSQLPLLSYTELPVLLTGETGVGKDHLAKYYKYIIRPNGPFISINCASLPETLLESELFGYVKGAFTGADSSKEGHFVAANNGVLFLDEIGDMPLSLQTKLLGVLEDRRVVPLGSTKQIDLNFKLVAATNANLEEMVDQGKFRRDLYYRLSGMCFHIKPLRERKSDIPPQLERFMQQHELLKEGESLPPEFVRQFIEYDWPGNTRELYNKVKRLKVMTMMVAEGDLVELSRTIFPTSNSIKDKSLSERVDEFEQKIIIEAMLASRGNKSEAARMLGIHEATMRTKLKRYNISFENYRFN